MGYGTTGALETRSVSSGPDYARDASDPATALALRAGEWMKMRMVLVAGLLMIALLGAVLGSIKSEQTGWASAPDEVNGPPAREISDRIGPGTGVLKFRG